jgi:hypothetical protein
VVAPPPNNSIKRTPFRRRLFRALEGRVFSICVGPQRRVAFASWAAQLCFVLRLAGLRVCGVGAKVCSWHVVRAGFAFVLFWLAGARVIAVRGVSRGGLAVRRRPRRSSRIAGSYKQRYRFFERRRNGAAVLTIQSSGRRSAAAYFRR